MGPVINTSYDEEAPFIHPDKTTLYFSSNKYQTKDRFDIYTSSWSASLDQSGGWTPPVHIGYPIKAKDDAAIYLAATNNKPIPALSDELPAAIVKKDGKTRGIEKNYISETNNYIVTFADQKKIPLTLLKGKVIGADGKNPRLVTITVTNNETGEKMGIYHCSDLSGDYCFILPPEKNHNITYEAEGYLFQSENINTSNEAGHFAIQQTATMFIPEVGSKIALHNIFFNQANSLLLPVSNTELDHLFNFLITNPNRIVEISYTLNSYEKAKIKYNELLSRQRAEAVVSYLIEKGIPEDRMGSKSHANRLKLKKEKKKSPSENNSQQKKPFEGLELKIIEKK